MRRLGSTERARRRVDHQRHQRRPPAAMRARRSARTSITGLPSSRCTCRRSASAAGDVAAPRRAFLARACADYGLPAKADGGRASPAARLSLARQRARAGQRDGAGGAPAEGPLVIGRHARRSPRRAPGAGRRPARLPRPAGRRRRARHLQAVLEQTGGNISRTASSRHLAQHAARAHRALRPDAGRVRRAAATRAHRRADRRAGSTPRAPPNPPGRRDRPRAPPARSARASAGGACPAGIVAYAPGPTRRGREP